MRVGRAGKGWGGVVARAGLLTPSSCARHTRRGRDPELTDARVERRTSSPESEPWLRRASISWWSAAVLVPVGDERWPSWPTTVLERLRQRAALNESLRWGRWRGVGRGTT